LFYYKTKLITYLYLYYLTDSYDLAQAVPPRAEKTSDLNEAGIPDKRKKRPPSKYASSYSDNDFKLVQTSKTNQNCESSGTKKAKSSVSFMIFNMYIVE
jgi:hypothetical protein